MNFSFTLYETLRRLLLLGVGVGVLGFMLTPDDSPVEMAGGESAAEPVEAVAAGPVPQKTLI